MQKVKSQIIVPDLPKESDKITFVLSSFDVQEKPEAELFLLVDLDAKKKENSEVFKKLISDTFFNVINLDEVSPKLQILEKALKACRDAAAEFSEESVFNAVAAVFIDDVVHISIYGDSKALYLDGTSVVPISTSKEGKYSGVSEKIQDGKVIVLCSMEFYKSFPPKTLTSLTKPILSQDLNFLSSAVILKADVAKKVQLSSEDDSSKETPASTKVSISDKKHRAKMKLPISILIPVVFLVLAIVAVVAFVFLRKANSEVIEEVLVENTTESVIVEPTKDSEEPKAEVKGELSKKLDEANKVRRVSPKVFYDISITDSKANPSELALGVNYIAVSDSLQGKIYVSNLSVSKFEELPQLFPGVRNLSFNNDVLVFTDNEGIKYYDLAKKAVVNSYFTDSSLPIGGPSIEYSGFTYAFSGDALIKYSKVGTQLKGINWAESVDFANAKAIGIDGSIYILLDDGSVVKYTGGAKDDFTLVGLDTKVSEPLKLIADPGFKLFYLADGEEGRVLAFDTDGVLSFQLKPELGSEWSDLRSLGISNDEKSYFVLVGTKVLEFAI